MKAAVPTEPKLVIFATRDTTFLISASVFMLFFIGLIMGTTAETTKLYENTMLLLAELSLALPTVLLARARGHALGDLIPRQPISLLTIVMVLVLAAGVIGLISVFEVLVVPFFPLPDILLQAGEDLTTGGPMAIGILMIATVLAAPLVEETLMRGVLQQSVFYHFQSMIPTLVIPTVIFTLLHVGYLFYIPAMVEMVTLGLLLGFMVYKTENIFPAMIIHSAFNLSAHLSAFQLDVTNPGTLADLGTPWILLSVLATGLGLAYFFLYKPTRYSDVYLSMPALPPEDEGDAPW